MKRSDRVSSQRKYGPSVSLRLRDVSIALGTERGDKGSMQNPEKRRKRRDGCGETHEAPEKVLEDWNSPATGVLRP